MIHSDSEMTHMRFRKPQYPCSLQDVPGYGMQIIPEPGSATSPCVPAAVYIALGIVVVGVAGVVGVRAAYDSSWSTTLHSNSSVIASPYTVAPLPTPTMTAHGTHQHGDNGALVPLPPPSPPPVQFTRTALWEQQDGAWFFVRHYSWSRLESTGPPDITHQIAHHDTTLDTQFNNGLDASTPAVLTTVLTLEDFSSIEDFLYGFGREWPLTGRVRVGNEWVREIRSTITRWRMDYLNYNDKIYDVTLVIYNKLGRPKLHVATSTALSDPQKRAIAQLRQRKINQSINQSITVNKK